MRHHFVGTVINLGLRWSIGRGDEERIWEDRWFPIPSWFQIFSLKPPHCDLVLVEEITESKNWNILLLSHLFSDVEIQSILSFSLSFRSLNARFIWHYDRKGIFLVECISCCSRLDLISKGSCFILIC